MMLDVAQRNADSQDRPNSVQGVIINASENTDKNVTYIWQQSDWPNWRFDVNELTTLLKDIHETQSRIVAFLKERQATHQEQAALCFLTEDVLNTSEIENERLNPDAVRASVARHLGLDIGIPIQPDQQIDAIVTMVLDAAIHYAQPLTPERLFFWHDTLFPTCFNIISTINTESWRDDALGPMQVVSGPIGHQKIHYQAPPAACVNEEMARFLHWFNAPATTDPFIKAGLAHLWFLTIHPFGDGNGRIARAINDMALTRAMGSSQRFYSYAAQLQRDRDEYYTILELTQKGSLEVTVWLSWFLAGLYKAISAAEVTLVSNKASS